MQVAHVAGDIEGSHLPFAVEHLVEAAGQTAGDKTGMLHAFPRRDNVVIRAEGLRLAAEVEDRVLLIARQD
jgi:hypothetical protein